MSPDIIIIAGDIFNQAKTWSDRGLHETDTIVGYISQLSQIAPVCVLRGTANHDGKMHYDLLTTALNNNANVYIIDEPCVKNINDLAAVTFVPIFDKNTHRADGIPLDKEAENNYFCDKVRDSILDLKKQADAYNLPTILVTHYTVLGAIMPNGQTSIFANNEVIIDPITLIQSDYWLTCLGHIHKPQQIEACPNTFYSGSLCALTFNDENDPHGFYMHYITDHDNISSEFIEIPSRNFHTIWLNDSQLTAIIANDYDLSAYIDEPMNGDIIRVIYTATDVTNKALNKALLEKALYDQTGAFYVQEIIPAEINITVDKTTMRNTASAADNLLIYLKNEQTEHHSISDAQIDDCMNLAQPIIDRLLADKTSNYNIGIFTPIEIEVKNYRNYKDAVFNYNDVKFCVINGDNGAGKSSLFMDAMLDALFEETREGDITGWINNDINIRSGSIRFTFSIGPNTYRITRTRQKSGKATLNLSQLVADADGNLAWVDMSGDKIKDTQENINRIIGMNAMTLKSCGLIMQDAYGLFLQADKNTRMDILGDILNLDIYADLNTAVIEFGQTCQRELNKITDEETNILSNLKNGDEIKTNLTAAYNESNAHRQNLTLCSNELLACSLKREELLSEINSYNRLTTDINALNDKRRQLCLTLEEQNTVIVNAYQIVSGEQAYIQRTNRYNELLLLEKSMSEKSAMIQSLVTVHNQLDANMTTTSNIIADADNKLRVLTDKKTAVEIQLNDADSIAANASLYEKTKQEIAEIEEKLAIIRDLETQRREYQLKQDICRNAYSSRKETLEAKLTDIDKKSKILTESGCPDPENATCKFLADAKQSLAELPELKREYAANEADFKQQFDSLTQAVADCNDQIQTMTENLPDINHKKQELAVYENCALKMASIPELKNTLAAYEQQIADFNAIKTDNINTLNSLNEQLRKNAAEITTLTSEIADYDKIKAEIASLGDLVKQGNEIAANKALMSAADKRVNELMQEIQALDADIADKTGERSSINIDTIAVNKIDTDILACQTRQNLLNQNIADCNKLIGQLELELKQYQSDIRQLDKLKQLKDRTAYIASNADWLKKAFCKTGIPHNIIRSVIPVLQTTATNILNQMSGNTMSIELRTEKTLTTKKEIATLDVIVCDTATGDLPYLSRSGGERVKAALSVVLALAEIKSNESGTQLGFLFIDEPPFLDSNGIEAYCDALEAIQKRYSDLKIMAITHDPEMKSRFAQSIDVVKTDNGSEIYENL